MPDTHQARVARLRTGANKSPAVSRKTLLYKVRVSETRFKVYCLIQNARWWYNTFDAKGKWVSDENTAAMLTENDIVATFSNELYTFGN